MHPGAPLTDTASLLALLALPGVGPAKALACAHGHKQPPASPDVASARRRVVELAEQGIRLVGFFDDTFPQRLRDIPSPPAVLYVRGPVDALHQARTLAVVGTRRPSRFGVSATETVSRVAARAGAVIASGLALGVDGVSHRCALQEGALTVAVLGGGVDAPTPTSHQPLAHQIISSGGCLISEQPPGTPPTPQTLVARNRLQAGLAAVVFIGQTAVDGGTPHTARFAAQQGRPVFCPRPQVPHAASEGLELLLDCPARDLPARMPAFASAKRLCAQLGDEPLARPVTRDTVDVLLGELARDAA